MDLGGVVLDLGGAVVDARGPVSGGDAVIEKFCVAYEEYEGDEGG